MIPFPAEQFDDRTFFSSTVIAGAIRPSAADCVDVGVIPHEVDVFEVKIENFSGGGNCGADANLHRALGGSADEFLARAERSAGGTERACDDGGGIFCLRVNIQQDGFVIGSVLVLSVTFQIAVILPRSMVVRTSF